mmetsp:Transcript_1092/g.3430  ORF Transcript_1092/g.3430 Transcript_1092/m.3430 type:complete len:233 (-) Transcript_1092:1753-2451(-)
MLHRADGRRQVLPEAARRGKAQAKGRHRRGEPRSGFRRSRGRRVRRVDLQGEGERRRERGGAQKARRSAGDGSREWHRRARPAAARAASRRRGASPGHALVCAARRGVGPDGQGRDAPAFAAAPARGDPAAALRRRTLRRRRQRRHVRRSDRRRRRRQRGHVRRGARRLRWLLSRLQGAHRFKLLVLDPRPAVSAVVGAARREGVRPLDLLPRQARRRHRAQYVRRVRQARR